MSWNAYTDPIPSEAEQELPDLLIDAVIAMVNSADNPDDLARWALEAISGSVGLSIQVGDPHDPVKRYKQFEEAALGTFAIAGESHRELRLSLSKAAADHCRSIARIGHDWAAQQSGFKKHLFGSTGGNNQRVAYLDGVAWPLVNMASS